MSVPVRARKFWNFEHLWFFVKSCLVLGKLLKSCWRSESFWRLILEPPKMAKVEAYHHHYTPIRCIFLHCFFECFFTYFFSEISTILRNTTSIWGGSAYLLHKKSVSCTCIEFRHFRFLRHTNRIWVGSAARNAAHSTWSAYSDGGRPQTKSMGKANSSSLTDKHFRVTTGSLTSRLKKKCFLVF